MQHNEIKVNELDLNPLLPKDLLIELGTEELPAKGLETLSEAFVQRVSACLEKAGLVYSNLQGFVTPRRLAVLVSQLSPFQPDRTSTKRGPAKAQAYDDKGEPTEVLMRFAKACNVSPDKLTVQETPKGAWLVFEQKERGKTSAELMPTLVEEAIRTLPLPKRMRWGTSGDEFFIRPVHWVVLMLGDQLIPAQYFGIKSETSTRGHRFLSPAPIQLLNPTDYENSLNHPGMVIADFRKRKESIRQQMSKVIDDLSAQTAKPAKIVLDEELLNEVTGLVEWPVVLLGSISAEFLELPREVLITTLQTHQKCFALQDNNDSHDISGLHDQKGFQTKNDLQKNLQNNLQNKNAKLLPNFLIISNINSIDPNCVIHGNECVVHARLADAAFYYKVDQETTLVSRREKLKQVVFQQGLGSLWDKTERIRKLSQIIAAAITADQTITMRGAELCKSDLLTNMVLEFPELQGVMGKYYALHDKEPSGVAEAIQEHYHPRFAQDVLPVTLEGICLALADRIDSLVGIFGIGKRPSGEKDPYALRRQAFAVLRIMIEKDLPLDLLELFIKSADIYGKLLPNHNFIQELLDFCFERLRTWVQEQDITVRMFNAVLERRPTSPYDFYQRLLAVYGFSFMPESKSLAEANKRVRNILSKTTVPTAELDIKLLKEDAEKDLMMVLIAKEEEIAPLMAQKKYKQALTALASLKEPVDTFFDKVMVMVDDPVLRDNRLKLLQRLRNLFLKIADISEL